MRTRFKEAPRTFHYFQSYYNMLQSCFYWSVNKTTKINTFVVVFADFCTRKNTLLGVFSKVLPVT